MVNVSGRALGPFLLMVSGVFPVSPLSAYPPSEKHTEDGGKKVAKSGGALSEQERKKRKEEGDELFRLGSRILWNLGCTDFRDKAMKAIISYLRKSKGPRVFTQEEQVRLMAGHVGIRIFSPVAPAKFESETNAYSRAVGELNQLIWGGIYESFDLSAEGYEAKPMLPHEIADILDSPDGKGRDITDRLNLALDKINAVAQEDRLNIACRLPAATKHSNKNGLLAYSQEKDENGKPKIMAYENFIKELEKDEKMSYESVTDATKTEKSAIPKKVAAETVVPKKKSKTKPDLGTAALSATKLPSLEADHGAEKPKKGPPKKEESAADKAEPAPKGDENTGLVKKYLSIPQSELGKFWEAGWHSEYDDFLLELVQTENSGILKNFSKFGAVCRNIGDYNTTAKKLYFVRGFFRALADAESNTNPRIETRETMSRRTRLSGRGKPASLSREDYMKVRSLSYVKHSNGLFQISEEAAFDYGCREIDYVNDVTVGFPSSRTRLTTGKYKGTYVEYLGDTRRTVLNPFVNIKCAAKILENRMSKLSTLISSRQYWAGLTTANNRSQARANLRTAIRRELPGC